MPSRRASLAIAWAILFAGGCRHVAPQPLSPEQSADRLAERSLSDAGLRDFLAQQAGRSPEAWPQTHWELSDLTLAALYFSLDLRVTRATAGVAAAEVGVAAQRPNPTLSFLPQRVLNPESGISPWLATVQLDWPIETAGKRSHRRAAAAARAGAADLAVRTAAWRIRGAVYDGAVGVSAAEARRALLAHNTEIRDQRLSLLERRRAAGEISEALVAPERLARTRAIVDLAAAERELDAARAKLASALGIPPAALDAIDVAFALDAAPGGVEALAGADAQRAALLGRSDVLALLAEYDAAEQDLRLELAKQYPDLHLGPGYEFDQGANKWGLGLSLELPLLNQNQGGIDAALARRGEVAARFEALQAQVISEVATASAALHGSRREEATARLLLAQAQRGAELAQKSFQEGAADRLGLLDAELEGQLAAGALIDAQERVHRAVAELERMVEPPGVLEEPGSGAPLARESGAHG